MVSNIMIAITYALKLNSVLQQTVGARTKHGVFSGTIRFTSLSLECHKLRITTSNGNKDNVTWDNLFCTKVGGVNIPENMLFICPLRQLVICVTHFTDRKTFWLSLSDKKITSSPWLRPLLAMMDNFLSLIILHLLFSYSGEWGIRCSTCICKF